MFDTEFIEEDLIEFELTNDILIYYNKTDNYWYAENLSLEEENTFILEDLDIDIQMEEEDILLWEYLLTKKEFEEIKELVKRN